MVRKSTTYKTTDPMTYTELAAHHDDISIIDRLVREFRSENVWLLNNAQNLQFAQEAIAETESEIAALLSRRAELEAVSIVSAYEHIAFG